MFRIVILGSGASLPTLQRHTAAVAVQYEGDVHLLDCGEGTQLQWRRTGLKFGRLRTICVSHLHGDHINGLVGLLQTLSLSDRTAPLQVHGPPGLADYVRGFRRTQRVRVAYPLEIVEHEAGAVFRGDGYRIEAGGLDHGVRTLGYALVEDDRPGRFDVEAARRLGLEPGPAYGRLQRGESVDTPAGERVRPEQVLGPGRPGRRVAYCVDTRPCEEAVRLARRASVFLCDSTFGTELEAEARDRGHCTAAQAAEMARKAEADRLVLTHVSARYGDARPLLEEAREVFSNTTVAADLMEIAV